MTTKITSDNIDATVASTTSLNTATAPVDTNAFNISLLGFKMAVNEGLTVFNLVDGVVDEFNDESGTDESEGSNDYYSSSCDFYTNNCTCASVSAGFSTTAITEPDTSTAGTNPAVATGTYGTFTVPSSDITDINVYAWGGAGGFNQNTGGTGGGGSGGFVSGNLSVVACQQFRVVVGEGGANSPGQGADFGALGNAEGGSAAPTGFSTHGGGGGGLSGLFTTCLAAPNIRFCGSTAPQAYIIAGAGGGGGYYNTPGNRTGGAGGGLTGDAGGSQVEQTTRCGAGGGGGSQTQGGTGGAANVGNCGFSGGLFRGGEGGRGQPGADDNSGGGGAGYYGGGGGTSPWPSDQRFGGGGSSYYNHPQITCGSTEEGNFFEAGGDLNPFYPTISPTNPSFPQGVGVSLGAVGSCLPGVSSVSGDGYVLIQKTAGSFAGPGGGSSTIVSTAFTSSSVATSARVVVFEENVDTPTLNTDIIASVSRDGGTTYTNATLSDSGYVTGSSGQRILTGQADISGQPSGQSMRWKLALANNTVKIHGVSLQWS